MAPSTPDPREGNAATADTVAFWAAVALPVLGTVLKVVNGGWVLLALLLWSPLIVIIWGTGLAIFRGTLGPRSDLRALLGRVPTHHRVLAWVWAVAMFLPGFVLLDGGDAPPLRAPLLTLLGLDQPDWYWTFQDVVMLTVAVLAVGAPLAAWLLARHARQRWEDETVTGASR